MNGLDRLRALGRTAQYSPVVAAVLDSRPAAIVLNQLVFLTTPGQSGRTWADMDDDGWFAMSTTELGDHLWMAEKQLRLARERLEEAGVVETGLTATMPPRLIWRIVPEGFDALIDRCMATVKSGPRSAVSRPGGRIGPTRGQDSPLLRSLSEKKNKDPREPLARRPTALELEIADTFGTEAPQATEPAAAGPEEATGARAKPATNSIQPALIPLPTFTAAQVAAGCVDGVRPGAKGGPLLEAAYAALEAVWTERWKPRGESWRAKNRKAWDAWVRAKRSPSALARAVIGMGFDDWEGRPKANTWDYAARREEPFLDLYERHVVQGKPMAAPAASKANAIPGHKLVDGYWFPEAFTLTQLDHDKIACGDQHLIIFDGSLDWLTPAYDRNGRIAAQDAHYGRPVNHPPRRSGGDL